MIPVELYAAIARYLPAKEYFRMRSSCRQLYHSLPLPELTLQDFIRYHEFLHQNAQLEQDEESCRKFCLRNDHCTVDAFCYLAENRTCWFELSQKGFRFLSVCGIDYSWHYNAFINAAAKMGNLALMKQLLRIPTIDPSESLRIASKFGRASIVELLLKDRRIEPNDMGGLHFQIACLHGHLEVVKVFLQDTRLHLRQSKSINTVCTKGYLKILELLLAHPLSNTQFDPSQALSNAARNGHAGVVARLLADPRVDPRHDDNYAIQCAALMGHDKVVRLMLRDPRVVLLPYSDMTLVRAIRTYCFDLVTKLLENHLSLIDPSCENNVALVTLSAFASVQYHSIELLLKDPRVDPSIHDSIVFRRVCSWSKLSPMVRILLADPRVNPAANYNEVDLLLADPRIDPAAENNEAIIFAARNSFRKLVARLLQDPRVDPCAQDHQALRYAIRNRQWEIMVVLLQDPRVWGVSDNVHVLAALQALAAKCP
ncbi:hypothetical protein HDU91_002322 [Kappamyces sp. JEL0680]|nr:hypothetical protein HDU91_002322 [Kappamyces sp. JEL0680]